MKLKWQNPREETISTNSQRPDVYDMKSSDENIRKFNKKKYIYDL